MIEAFKKYSHGLILNIDKVGNIYTTLSYNSLSPILLLLIVVVCNVVTVVDKQQFEVDIFALELFNQPIVVQFLVELKFAIECNLAVVQFADICRFYFIIQIENDLKFLIPCVFSVFVLWRQVMYRAYDELIFDSHTSSNFLCLFHHFLVYR